MMTCMCIISSITVPSLFFAYHILKVMMAECYAPLLLCCAPFGILCGCGNEQ